jgi:hypothetical protein
MRLIVGTASILDDNPSCLGSLYCCKVFDFGSVQGTCESIGCQAIAVGGFKQGDEGVMGAGIQIP